MESLYAKLYDKYERMKNMKFSEIDEINKDQELKFLNQVSAADQLIQHLRSENEKLHVQVEDLRNSVISIRSAKDVECAEYQKLVLEEKQKNNILSEEIRSLKLMRLEGISCNIEDQINSETTPETPRTRKHSRRSQAKTKRGAVSPDCSNQDNSIVIYDKQPACCKRNRHQSGSAAYDSCVFQALLQYIMSVELSTLIQDEYMSIIALHQSSGYSFSLTWLSSCPGGEIELLYHVLSLGTLKLVAPEWMREDLKFSPSMCQIFFQRIANVLHL